MKSIELCWRTRYTRDGCRIHRRQVWMRFDEDTQIVRGHEKSNQSISPADAVRSASISTISGHAVARHLQQQSTSYCLTCSKKHLLKQQIHSDLFIPQLQRKLFADIKHKSPSHGTDNSSRRHIVSRVRRNIC
jgi:hypothetical protein